MSLATHRQILISTGNETFDRFLGGGLLNSSLNLFERQGPSSRVLDDVCNKSLAAVTLTTRGNLLYVNFNTSATTSTDKLLESLPAHRKVKSELLYKDVRSRTAHAKIKIAWRYSNRTQSPSDPVARSSHVDFGLSLVKDSDSPELGQCSILNVSESNFTLESFLTQLDLAIANLKSPDGTLNIIIKDILHPFSPLLDDAQEILKLFYALRCIARRIEKGCILMSYDCTMFSDHASFRSNLYNLADCVVAFYSYKTDENISRGYKDADGTLKYVKVPKINSFGFHFQQDLTDWGYRLTRNHRFFVVDELSLPPCDDDRDEEKKKRKDVFDVTDIHGKITPLRQVGPLEDFREVAQEVFTKRL